MHFPKLHRLSSSQGDDVTVWSRCPWLGKPNPRHASSPSLWVLTHLVGFNLRAHPVCKTFPLSSSLTGKLLHLIAIVHSQTITVCAQAVIWALSSYPAFLCSMTSCRYPSLFATFSRWSFYLLMFILSCMYWWVYILLSRFFVRLSLFLFISYFISFYFSLYFFLERSAASWGGGETVCAAEKSFLS